jgi:hypothetical protein
MDIVNVRRIKHEYLTMVILKVKSIKLRLICELISPVLGHILDKLVSSIKALHQRVRPVFYRNAYLSNIRSFVIMLFRGVTLELQY